MQVFQELTQVRNSATAKAGPQDCARNLSHQWVSWPGLPLSLPCGPLGMELFVCPHNNLAAIYCAKLLYPWLWLVVRRYWWFCYKVTSEFHGPAFPYPYHVGHLVWSCLCALTNNLAAIYCAKLLYPWLWLVVRKVLVILLQKFLTIGLPRPIKAFLSCW